MQISSLSFVFLVLSISFPLYKNATCCYEVERDSLLSFHHSISALPPLHWSRSSDCCQWKGIRCNVIQKGVARVTYLSLPERNLSGTLNTSFLANLPFLTHINLSHNHFSGPLLLHSSLLPSFQAVDLSSNTFSGSFHPLFLHRSFNQISLNLSNNSFTGSIPSSICKASKLVQILDFSMNKLAGPISPGFLSECRNLRVLRAGDNSLFGLLPYDLYTLTSLKEISLPNNQFSGPIKKTIVMLSNLTILDLHSNQLSGEIPPNIGLLSNLEELVLYTNVLNGSLPPSLMDCSKLASLVLTNNQFAGDISTLNFSKLHRVKAIDLSFNNFTGSISHTLCSCTSLIALRFSHNHLAGEIPRCIPRIKTLQHLALAKNNLTNIVGAFKILRHCGNLKILFLSGNFHGEMMPDDNDLDLSSGGGCFQNLQALSLGDCSLKGQIPSWIAKLTKLERLSLARNKISGTVPSWLGAMPRLHTLNLTGNRLSGPLPQQLGLMPALISDDIATSDLCYLHLPFLLDGNQYTRMYNLPRGLVVGGNSLSGNIPPQIGALKHLQALDLSNNNFTGNIPQELSHLTNLLRLNMSGNHLSGEIPESLQELHFMSSFSVAHNDLQGQVPAGGQFDTFPPNSFEGNPKLCGEVVNKSCSSEAVEIQVESAEKHWCEEVSWYGLPFGLGYSVGVIAVAIVLLSKST